MELFRANTISLNTDRTLYGCDASVRKSCFKFSQRALLCDNNIISTTNRNTWATSTYIVASMDPAHI